MTESVYLLRVTVDVLTNHTIRQSFHRGFLNTTSIVYIYVENMYKCMCYFIPLLSTILCFFSILFTKSLHGEHHKLVLRMIFPWKYYTHFDSILLSLYKVNWICFLTSMRLKRSWADSTFNIYLCDAALCCLLSYPLLYTHKFIYFPPFFRCSLCDFTIWLQKNDFSFHKWPFHSNINIICRLICYWFFFSVLGFFMVDVFVSGLLK